MAAFIQLQQAPLEFRSNASISAHPGAKEGICVDTKGLSLPHYLLCRAAE